jgi:hypothetical protein
MAKASDFKKMHEADNHFVIRHPDGSHFKIAKKGLDKGALDKISGMPQHFDDGGQVQPQDTPQDMQSQELPSLSDGVTAAKNAIGSFFTSGPQVTNQALAESPNPAVAQAAQGAIAAQPNAVDPSTALASTTPGAVPGADGQPSYDGSVGVPKAVAPKANPNDPLTLYNKAFGQQVAGIKGEANAQAQQGEDTRKALDSAAVQNQILMANTAKKQEEYAAETAQLEKDYRTNKINPNQVYQNMGTGNRILAGISLVLGGLAGGLNKTGSNVAMDVINNSISRDIDAQKANMDQRHNLLRINMEKTKNLNEATMLTQNQLLAAAKIQTEMAAAKAQGPLAQAKAQELIGGITAQQAQLQMSLAQMRAKADLTSGGGSPLTPFLASDKDIASRVVSTNTDANGNPLYHLAGSEESAKAQKMVENDSKTVLQNIAQLKKIASQPSSAINPEQRAIFDNLKNEVGAQLGTLSGVNRFNEAEAQINKDTLGKLGLGQATGSTMAKINQAEEFLTRMRENSRQTHLLNYKSPAPLATARPHTKQ